MPTQVQEIILRSWSLKSFRTFSYRDVTMTTTLTGKAINITGCNQTLKHYFRLLESTRSFLVASEELTLENEAISTAIQHFGLKKQTFEMLDNNQDNNTSDDSNLPSTSSQSPSSSRQHSSTSTSSSPLNLESEAINSAISSYGLHKNGI